MLKHCLAAEQALHRRIAALSAQVGLPQRIRQACCEQGVDYDHGPGRRLAIDLMPAPTLLPASHLRFLQRLSETINLYVRRMPALWLQDRIVREILPLSPEVLSWFQQCWQPHHEDAQTLVARNDVDMPASTRQAVAFEPNGCSIGGIYYAAACARVVADQALNPALDDESLRPLRPRLHPLDDICDIATDLLLDHAQRIGLSGKPVIGILENRDWTVGITEMPSFARHLQRRGFQAVLGDPRELEQRGGNFWLSGKSVDLFYRNMELADFVALETEGACLATLREVFRRNRVVSSLAGDFDHKSVWEVLTSPATRHLVQPEHRAFLRRHLLWTRLLRETHTTDPEGRRVDLVAWVLANRQRLVLKPNCACGGEGVTLGPLLDENAWSLAVERALQEQGDWVVQRFHQGTRKNFPVADEEQGPFYVTYGIVSAPFGQGILGRACRRPVVNVSCGGGLVALFRHGRAA